VGILASDMAYGVVRQEFDPGLQVFLRECIPVAAQTRSCLQGWTRVILYCSQMGKQLSQRRATCAGGMIIVSECLSQSLDSIRTINLNDYYYLYI
jgi:hypothetical protein